MQLDPAAFVADPELIQALEARSTAIDCNEDRVLFEQGDFPAGIYALKQGELTLTMRSPTGEMVTEVQAPAGSLLGLPGLIGKQPYTLSAIARNGARLSFIPQDDFTTLMQSDAHLALKILQVLAAEVRSARRALSDI